MLATIAEGDGTADEAESSSPARAYTPPWPALGTAAAAGPDRDPAAAFEAGPRPHGALAVPAEVDPEEAALLLLPPGEPGAGAGSGSGDARVGDGTARAVAALEGRAESRNGHHTGHVDPGSPPRLRGVPQHSGGPLHAASGLPPSAFVHPSAQPSEPSFDGLLRSAGSPGPKGLPAFAPSGAAPGDVSWPMLGRPPPPLLMLEPPLGQGSRGGAGRQPGAGERLWRFIERPGLVLLSAVMPRVSAAAAQYGPAGAVQTQNGWHSQLERCHDTAEAQAARLVLCLQLDSRPHARYLKVYAIVMPPVLPTLLVLLRAAALASDGDDAALAAARASLQGFWLNQLWQVG